MSKPSSTVDTLSVLESVVDTSELDGKYLTFWTDGQLYGIPIINVVQIVQMQEITSIPESPSYMVGIINLRGSIVPVIDVRLRFGKTSEAYSERTCIIVANIGQLTIGFIVDGVDEVTDIADEEISPPPSISHSAVNTFLTGIGKTQKKVTLLLDVEKLLSGDEIALLSELETAI